MGVYSSKKFLRLQNWEDCRFVEKTILGFNEALNCQFEYAKHLANDEESIETALLKDLAKISKKKCQNSGGDKKVINFRFLSLKGSNKWESNKPKGYFTTGKKRK